MRKKDSQPQSSIKPARRRFSALPKWIDTFLAVALFPVMFLGFVYVLVFFFLNSSYATLVLNTALSSFLLGEYDIRYAKTDPFLHTIYLDSVRLSEKSVPGIENAVIYARYANAKIPLLELFQLISSNTLSVGRIEAIDAVVRLDFTKPVLNILNVVLPANMSDEEDPEPSTFVLKMSDLNVTHGRVLLLFDGFSVDLRGVTVKNYGLKVANGLEMVSPMVEGDALPNIRVEKAIVRFNPATFSFPLSRYGDKSTGLVFSLPSQSADSLSQAFNHLGVALAQKALAELENPEETNPRFLTEKRGDFVVTATNVHVNGFRWFGNEFEITDTQAGLSTGSMRMRDAWMHVAPTPEAIAASAKRYNNVPSGEPSAILWAAKLDVDLPIDDPVMKYFFGDMLQSTKPFQLRSSLSGDLARVDGAVNLTLPEAEVAGIQIHRADLKGYLAGQKFGIKALEAETRLGALYANGYYKIMDGDFDVALYSGNLPENVESPLSDGFAQKLRSGLTPLQLFDIPALKPFSGALNTSLKVSSQNGELAVTLDEPMEWKLDQPIGEVQKIQIQPLSVEESKLITLNDTMIQSPAGLKITTGNDYLVVEPGLSVDIYNLESIHADVNAQFESLAPYAAMAGLANLDSGPVALSVNFDAQKPSLDGRFYFHAEDVIYEPYRIDLVHVDLKLIAGKLSTQNFLVNSSYANLNFDINADLIDKTTQQIHSDPMQIPLDVRLQVRDVHFDQIPLPILQDLNLNGHAGAELRFTGTAANPNATLNLDANNVTVMDEKISDVTARVRYANNVISVPFLGVWLDNENKTQHSDDTDDTQDASRKTDSRRRENPELNSTNTQIASTTNTSTKQTMVAITTASDVVVEENQQQDLRRRRGRVMLRNGKRADLSINTFSYDLNRGLIAFNAVLQPISPNDIQLVKKLELPIQGSVSFDLSANIDYEFVQNLIAGNKILQPKQSTWIEGDVNLNQFAYADIHVGNSLLQFSRSSTFIFIKGYITDYIAVSGFVRTNPNITASLALDFPGTEILDVLDSFGIDVSDLARSLNMHSFVVSGSVGLCYKGLDQITVTAIFDDIHSDLLGDRLALAGTSFIRYDVAKQQASISSLDFLFKDSRLKLSGNYNLNGSLDMDINGEIDASIAKVISSDIRDVHGNLGLSMSAKGNIYSNDKLSLKNLNINGFIGVRNPIQLISAGIAAPVVVNRGIAFLGRNQYCPKGSMCIVTPEEQSFQIGIGTQDTERLNLTLMATDRGMLNVGVFGEINAEISRLFASDTITDASGIISTQLSLEGSFFDKNKNLAFDLNQMKIGGNISIQDPLSLTLRSLADPIEVNSGVIEIADAQNCNLGNDCVIIRKEQAISGNVLSGPFVVFGEIRRNSLIPLGANITITGHNLNYRMKNELDVTVSPDLEIRIGDVRDFETYKLTGSIDVLEARYSKDFDAGGNNIIRESLMSLIFENKRRVTTYSPSLLRLYPELSKIQFNVNLAADNAIRADAKIANAVVDLEVSTNMNVSGNLKEIKPSGNVNITSGFIRLQGNEFAFQPGAQIAFNNSLDGKLEIVAQSEINTTSSAFSSILGGSDLDRRKRIKTSQNQSSELYIINLNVSGSLFNPTWSFDCSPYLSDANIYALILTGKTIDDIGGSVGSSAMDVAMGSLFSPIFSSSLDSFINMDEFKFLFSDGAAQIVFMKQINKGLRIAAGVALKGAEGNEQAVSGEYYFNDRWSIDLTGQNTSDEEGKAPTFKLSSRVNWHIPIDN